MDEQRRRLRNDEITLARGPSVELARMCEQNSADFAKSVIQVGLVVNAGAIVALPAVAGLLKDGVQAVVEWLVVAGILFALGIAFSWGAAIAAYFAIAIRQRVYEHRADHDQAKVEADLAETEACRQHHLATVTTESAGLDQVNGCYDRLRWVAIGLSFTGFACFVSGGGLAGFHLLWAVVGR